MTLLRIDHGTSTIEYELIYSGRRKSVGITIFPDGRVVVRAPKGMRVGDVETVVRKKGKWIVKKQQEFKDRPPAPTPPSYVSGENHLYLGQGYRLQVIENKHERVEITDDLLIIRVRDMGDLERKKKILEDWYRERAKIIFFERMEAVYPIAEKYGIGFPKIKIRLMRTQWGSCSTRGNVNLNLRLIQTPPACIDYVILHELAHFKEHNHSRAYYDLLEKMLPDWKERLEELNGIPVL